MHTCVLLILPFDFYLVKMETRPDKMHCLRFSNSSCIWKVASKLQSFIMLHLVDGALEWRSITAVLLLVAKDSKFCLLNLFPHYS